MKLLKIDLKLWNRDVFGNLNTTKKKILQEIEELDCQDVSGDVLSSVMLKRWNRRAG